MEINFIHGQFFFCCFLLMVLLRWRSHNATMNASSCTVGSILGALWWEPFTMITLPVKSFDSGTSRVPGYYVADSVLFTVGKQHFWTPACAAHIPNLEFQTRDACSRPAMAKIASSHRCQCIPCQNNARVSRKLLHLQKWRNNNTKHVCYES